MVLNLLRTTPQVVLHCVGRNKRALGNDGSCPLGRKDMCDNGQRNVVQLFGIIVVDAYFGEPVFRKRISTLAWQGVGSP